MGSDVVIRADGLGKKYLIGHQSERESYIALRDVIARNARNLWRTTTDVIKGRPSIQGDELEEFWALRDVSFEVKRGEVLGVIGRNGAGKSTLLKILSRITEPTEGRVQIRGRVSSLLEVGTGFHPELTGRENIYLNGAVLGMAHAEIRRKFDEIVAFAEVERFLDTPVKRYSSGMYVRLAFAVAAHLEPEILIIDEVLAVGDADFQKKCLGKMGEVAGEGRTVLFVSHNMAAVRTLCVSGLLLIDGKVAMEGESSSVISAYLAQNNSSCAFTRDLSNVDLPAIRSVKFSPAEITDDARATIEIVVCVTNVDAVSIDIRLKDAHLNPVGFGSLGALQSARPVALSPGETYVVVNFPTSQLANGSYYLSLDLTYPFVEYIDTVEDCICFQVLRRPRQGDVRRLEQSLGFGSVDIPVQLGRQGTTMPAQTLAALQSETDPWR